MTEAKIILRNNAGELTQIDWKRLLSYNDDPTDLTEDFGYCSDCYESLATPVIFMINLGSLCKGLS